MFTVVLSTHHQIAPAPSWWVPGLKPICYLCYSCLATNGLHEGWVIPVVTKHRDSCSEGPMLEGKCSLVAVLKFWMIYRFGSEVHGTWTMGRGFRVLVLMCSISYHLPAFQDRFSDTHFPAPGTLGPAQPPPQPVPVTLSTPTSVEVGCRVERGRVGERAPQYLARGCGSGHPHPRLSVLPCM